MRTYKLLNVLLLSVAAATLTPTATADVLYQQAPKNNGLGIQGNYTELPDPSNPSGPPVPFGTQNADSYSLGAPSTVTGFTWWGTDVVNLNSFVVRLFDTPLTPTPSVDLAGNITKQVPSSLQDSSTEPVFQFDMQLFTPLLLGGTGYLSVFLDSTDDWYWLEGAAGDDLSAFRGLEGDIWDTDAPDLALAVVGTRNATAIPEPGSLVLLSVAFMAALGTRRRQLRAATVVS